MYDQLIYVEEKDKFSGIDATIYAYFISSEDLSDQDSDKIILGCNYTMSLLKNMNK
ncbi:hypothetical protein [Mesomycoplasma ovipneumoniae]|uniref:hypothetical protein n=1 Tax=Mesomycoplasma ovipneumoniae TaxID=29562 RepID=UPI00311CC28E